jgi:hypothetical protein
MSYSQKRINKEFVELRKSLQIDDKLNILLSQSNDTIGFIEIRYCRNNAYLLKGKVREAAFFEINNFAREFIVIKVTVKYPLDYPFSPFVWELADYDSNIGTKDIALYYQYMIDAHNNLYIDQWSPAYSLRLDFTRLMVKFLKGIEYTKASFDERCA